MHRLLAAILLAGAVGGLVVFARHLGRVPEPVAVRLSAPPPQHLTAPGAVHAPLLVTARPAATFQAAANAVRPLRQAPAAPLILSAARPLTVPRMTTPPRPPVAPAARPPAVRTPVPAPAPTPPQEPVRVLAAVPLTPVDTATTTVSPPSTPSSSTAAKPGNGKAHAYGHLKQPKAAKSSSDPAPPATIPATPTPPAAVAQPAATVELTPVDPGAPASADADQVVHGHGWGRGNGKGHSG